MVDRGQNIKIFLRYIKLGYIPLEKMPLNGICVYHKT